MHTSALTPTPHRPSPKPKTSGLWRLLRRDDGALLLNSALQRHHRAPGALGARTQRRRAFRVPGLARACRTPSRILSAHRLRTDEAGVGPVKLLNLDADRALGGTAVLLTIWVWMLHVPHRHMNLRAALLASAPLPVVWTYTRPSALLVCAPLRLGRD